MLPYTDQPSHLMRSVVLFAGVTVAAVGAVYGYQHFNPPPPAHVTPSNQDIADRVRQQITADGAFLTIQPGERGLTSRYVVPIEHPWSVRCEGARIAIHFTDEIEVRVASRIDRRDCAEASRIAAETVRAIIARRAAP